MAMTITEYGRTSDNSCTINMYEPLTRDAQNKCITNEKNNTRNYK